MLRNILFSIILLFVACTSKSQPTDKDWVNDYIELLTTEQKTVLKHELQSLEDSVGSQLVVMIIDNLQGMEISEFSYHIANSWGIGRKDFDDGVLVLLSMNDRQMRIEVGYGLEKILKDEIAAQIIQEEMIPEFREQRFYEGLLAAVKKIKELILTNRNLIGDKY
jgi:uncharacterized membrane protein YgcG